MKFVFSRQRIFAAASLFAILAAVIIFVLLQQRSEDEVWLAIQQSGTLTIGMDASYPPFESVDEETGKLVGLDVDLANELGRRMKLRVEIVNIAYDGLLDALASGKVDALISGLADIPQAAGKAAFSIPYFNAGEVLVTLSDSEIASMDDLNNRTLAVEYGSGADVEARKWERRLIALKIVRTTDSEAAIMAIMDGRADAALADGISARLMVGQNRRLSLRGQVIDTLYAISTRPESAILRENLNNAIRGMFADGTIAGLMDKWFGSQP